MKLFGKKQNSSSAEIAGNKSLTADITISGLASDVLLRPHITEKSGILSAEKNVYTFDVRRSATKSMVKKAIKEIYKVAPEKIAMITKKGKKVFVRGRFGERPDTKKALVYLKKGDKIEFV